MSISWLFLFFETIVKYKYGWLGSSQNTKFYNLGSNKHEKIIKELALKILLTLP